MNAKGLCVGLALCAPFLAALAAAEVHQHPAADAPLHYKFYASWLMPNHGDPRVISCCNLQDCYPTTFKQEGGTWFARRREDGEWMPVPPAKLEHLQSDARESPDGQGHVCAGPGPSIAVYCAVVGTGA